MEIKKNKDNYQKSSKNGLPLYNAKIKGFGKSSINLINKELIFKSAESEYTVKKSVIDIDFLIYSKGNFFFDDTIYIGINGEQFEITCKSDESGLRNLYNTLVNIKADNPKSEPILTEYTPNNIKETEQKIIDDKGNVSVSEEIRNLYNLKNEGIITEEEFNEFKKELLKPNK